MRRTSVRDFYGSDSARKTDAQPEMYSFARDGGTMPRDQMNDLSEIRLSDVPSTKYAMAAMSEFLAVIPPVPWRRVRLTLHRRSGA